MIIDCGQCTVRGQACTECVVTFLTVPLRPGLAAAAGDLSPGDPDESPWASDEPDRYGRPLPDLDEAERRAIEVLARSGLVPPLRMRAV